MPPSEDAATQLSAGAEAPARAGRAISYRLSLVLYITALVALTGATLTLFALHNAANVAASTAVMVFRRASVTAAGQTRSYVLRAVPLAKSLEALAGNGLDVNNSDVLAHQLASVLRVNPQFTWISYGDKQGSFIGAHWDKRTLKVQQSHIDAAGHGAMIEHEVHADGSWTLTRSNDHWEYDARTRPYYRAAAEARKLVWVGPYVFFDEGLPGVTCADPLFDADAKLQGVITVDFDLRTLSQFAAQAQQPIGPRSKLVILTADGHILADPALRVSLRHGEGAAGQLPRVDDVNDPLAAALYAAVPAQVRGEEDGAAPRSEQSSEGNAHFHPISISFEREPYFAAATTFEVDDGLSWIVAVGAPQADFQAAARREAMLAAAVSSTAVLVAIGLGVVLARRVSGPILSLVAFMRRVGAGELEARTQLGGSPEFHELSAALNGMIAQLQDRLRLRNSIAVAQQVQSKLLPAGPPKIRGLDVAGHSTYCDETGGDYYDFLTFDQNPAQLFVTIGDVMGHGIGAALPMAGARAVLRTRAPAGQTPAKLLGELNRLLCEDFDGDGFMTMLIALVDAKRMTIRWASAGHDPILVYDPGEDQFFELQGADVPLGVLSDATYCEFTSDRLRPGHILVLGTDGIWEAANINGETFGKDRLRQTIRRAAAGTSAQIGAAIERDVDAFRGPAPCADDITLVVIKMLDGG